MSKSDHHKNASEILSGTASDIAESSEQAKFDTLADHFADKIYNSVKGKIRLALLQQDLAAIREQAPLKVLDAGGGMGHISRWIAQGGHQVSLCDNSAPMLERAKRLNEEAGLGHKISLFHADITNFCEQQAQQYDLIICHAVLEWLEDPQPVLAKLLTHLKPGGRLSLMFYNRHSLILRNALRGNLRKVKRGDWQGDGKGLTPHQALEPDDVYQWLDQAGIKIDQLSGIRSFYDYLPAKVKQTYAFADILELEQNHYQQQPYIHMARYIHVVGTLKT